MSFSRFFFKCKDCGFMFTTVTQINMPLEGGCPSCGGENVDYAPKADREQYARDLFEELEHMRDEINEREYGAKP